MPATLADVITVLDGFYDPTWAESWDAVGLVCGDPARPVERVLFAVDPVAAVVDEAVAWRADLLVTHHPLLLRPVNTVAATHPKGRLVHRMIQANLALFTAHTNADVAAPGVSDALARAVGLEGPLYPLAAAADDPRRGLGRIGDLPAPMTLRDFAERVGKGLPATAAGIRAAGDPGRIVRTVAVCGGAGDSLLATVRAVGVDAYVTADLRHHPASEFREHADPSVALIDAAHWATEWPWLADVRHRLAGALPGIRSRVSALVTDAWTLGVPQTAQPAEPAEEGAP